MIRNHCFYENHLQENRSITGLIIEQSHFVENAVDVDVSFFIIREVPAFVFGYLFRGNAMFSNTYFTVGLKIFSGLNLPVVMIGVDLNELKRSQNRKSWFLWTIQFSYRQNGKFSVFPNVQKIIQKQKVLTTVARSTDRIKYFILATNWTLFLTPRNKPTVSLNQRTTSHWYWWSKSACHLYAPFWTKKNFPSLNIEIDLSPLKCKQTNHRTEKVLFRNSKCTYQVRVHKQST